MSVLIRGIEMPQHCWQCPFKDDVDDCVLTDSSCMKVYGEIKRLDDCPLIEAVDTDTFTYTTEEITISPEKFLKVVNRKKTNAAWIRSMDDLTLARFLTSNFGCPCPASACTKETKIGCVNTILGWLQQEEESYE